MHISIVHIEQKAKTRADLFAKQRGDLPLQLLVEKGLSISLIKTITLFLTLVT